MTEIERIVRMRFSQKTTDKDIAKAIEQYVDQKIKIVQEDWEEEYRALEQEVIKARIEELEYLSEYGVGWDWEDVKIVCKHKIAELKKGLE